MSVSDADRGPAAPEATPGQGRSDDTQTTPTGAKDGRTAMRTALVVLVVLVFAALIVLGFRWIRENERVRDARERVGSAARLLDAVEDELLVVDEAVQADITSESATQAVEAIGLASTVATRLAEAASMIEQAAPELEGVDADLAKALLGSARARSEMMEEAPPILDAKARAARAIPLADQALAEIQAAQKLLGQAAAEFNKHTKPGVRASSDASAKAQSRLETARSLLTSATAEFPECDYAAFQTYIDAKISLAEQARKIDQLWLAGKIEESNKLLAAYNKRDAEVVEMAKKLPPSVRDPIADAYQAATKEAMARYFEARERARKAGERIAELREARGRSD